MYKNGYLLCLRERTLVVPATQVYVEEQLTVTDSHAEFQFNAAQLVFDSVTFIRTRKADQSQTIFQFNPTLLKNLVRE